MNKKAQTILEYIILIGIVTIVLFMMNQAIKRGYQSVIKLTADQIGNQQNADQSFSEAMGYLEESYSSTQSDLSKRTDEFVYTTNTWYNDRVESITNSVTNLGFTERKN